MKKTNRTFSTALMAALLLSLTSFDFAEHKKIGDEAFALLPYRLIDAGLFSHVDSVNEVLGYLFNLESTPESPYKILKDLSMSPNYVTYGTLNALSGDHVGNPFLLETELQTTFSKINRILALEIDEMHKFNAGGRPKDILSINPAYGSMAIRDLSHFLNYGRTLNDHLKMIDINLIEKLKDLKNVDEVFRQLELTNCLTKYYTIHFFAVHLAQESGRAQRANDKEKEKIMLYYAMLYESFAQHFLQDGFASGHMFVNRGFTASAVVNNKALHDFYNRVPTMSFNLKGESWIALGDKRLNDPSLNQEGYKYLRAEDQKFSMYDGIPDSVYNLGERKSQLLSHAVIATYTSMTEIVKAYVDVMKGADSDIIKDLRANEKQLDKYIFANTQTVYCIHIPYGSKRDEMPTSQIGDDIVEEFDKNIQLPFSRGFIRSRVANSMLVTLGTTNEQYFSIGGRINLSMINFNTADVGNRMLGKGRVIHWFNPTISGSYSRNADYFISNASNKEMAENLRRLSGSDMQSYMWNIKAGLNHTTDIFLSEKRFFSAFSYIEGGIDTRDHIYIDPNVVLSPDYSNFRDKFKTLPVSNFTFVPTVGLQLGSLIGLHRFTMNNWIRIPLSIILPLKISASYHMTSGMKPMWSFNSEIDILF